MAGSQAPHRHQAYLMLPGSQSLGTLPALLLSAWLSCAPSTATAQSEQHSSYTKEAYRSLYGEYASIENPATHGFKTENLQNVDNFKAEGQHLAVWWMDADKDWDLSLAFMVGLGGFIEQLVASDLISRADYRSTLERFLAADDKRGIDDHVAFVTAITIQLSDGTTARCHYATVHVDDRLFYFTYVFRNDRGDAWLQYWERFYADFLNGFHNARRDEK